MISVMPEDIWSWHLHSRIGKTCCPGRGRTINRLINKAMKSKRTLLALLAFVVAGPVRGTGGELFTASMDNSLWRYSGSRFQCDLEHEVPRFGRVKFVAEAGLPLRVEVHSGWMNSFAGSVGVISLPPPWEPPWPAREITPPHSLKAPDNRIEDGALAMAEDLRRGRWITLDLQRADHPLWRVRLINIGFNPAYNDFNQCRARLLTMNFEQARLTRLQYGQGKTQLTALQREQLKWLVEYILEDHRVVSIEIDGHTDLSGQSLKNRDISLARANRVREFLLEQGVSGKTIIVRGHGSRYPLKGKGPEQNRRVEIRLVRNSTRH